MGNGWINDGSGPSRALIALYLAIHVALSVFQFLLLLSSVLILGALRWAGFSRQRAFGPIVCGHFVPGSVRGRQVNRFFDGAAFFGVKLGAQPKKNSAESHDFEFLRRGKLKLTGIHLNLHSQPKVSAVGTAGMNTTLKTWNGS